jgi:hypothetical protein
MVSINEDSNTNYFMWKTWPISRKVTYVEYEGGDDQMGRDAGSTEDMTLTANSRASEGEGSRISAGKCKSHA